MKSNNEKRRSAGGYSEMMDCEELGAEKPLGVAQGCVIGRLVCPRTK
jgi:hypothetical protein